MLFGWPLVVVFFINRYPAKKAILWSLVGAALFLPAKFSVDLPLLPPLDKISVATLALCGALISTGKTLRAFQRGGVTKLLFAYLLTIFISSELNSFPVNVGGTILPGITHYDAFSSCVRFFIDFLPFLLGRRFLNDLNDTEYTFKVLTIVGLAYSLLMLIELRISPQMHAWVYGYSPTVFLQQIRDGGFRPIVFIGHGLPLAFLFSTFLLCGCALYKNKVRVTQVSPFAVLCYMGIVLLLCKTWSAVIYAFVGGVLILFAKPKTQLKLASAMALFAFLFPLIRVMGLLPTHALVNFVAEFSPDRAQSLGFRFINEDILLNRAMDRPFFGWGGWGRNRVYDEGFGEDTSVTDGRWIVVMGVNGLLGFISYFGMLVLPIFYSAKVIDKIESNRHKVYIAAQALILAFCVVDLLPNSNMGAVHLLLAGSLLGQAELILRLHLQKNTQPIALANV